MHQKSNRGRLRFIRQSNIVNGPRLHASFFLLPDTNVRRCLLLIPMKTFHGLGGRSPGLVQIVLSARCHSETVLAFLVSSLGVRAICSDEQTIFSRSILV